MIADVVAKGVTAEELERAKTRLIADAVYAQDSQAELARWYGAALTTGVDGRGGATAGPTASARSPPTQVQDAARQVARQAALGDRLSRSRIWPKAEKRS